MSFGDLIKNIPEQRIKLKGGLSQGYVKTKENLTVNKFTPTPGKGSEYAAKFRVEDDKAYFESMWSGNEDVGRVDLTSDEGPSQLCQTEDLTSIGTLPNIRELNKEELTQVYQNYNFTEHEPTEHLEPIFNEREQILRLIETNQVCIIKGPTGCGKSTQIPQFILDSYVKRRAHCNIVVTQPRRIAAITIAQHVCNERKWEVGGIVGYQVALDKNAKEDTRLLYCTTGVLLEKLINSKELNEYTHILLDEVHEREEDMDFVMLVVRRFLRSNSPNVKVVLMSATMDVTRFAKYFEMSLRNEKQPAPYYEIKPESKFSVQVHYLDALRDLGNLPAINEDEPGISKEAFMLVPMMIRAFNNIDLEDYKYKRSNNPKGAVLIFLPGLYQIETLYEILKVEDERSPGVFNLWLCPLHSSITKTEQEKVRNYAPQGKRKVILSTNIAESSITIPDVKYVIDFCLTKHLVADTVTGFTSLQMAWASHTNCLQREGRVGRVQDGRVYRIVPKKFYQFKMSKEGVPEMQRCPLEIIVLKCKKLMENECPLRLISSALDPPDLDNYEKTILKLKEIGALLITCRDEITNIDGDLTFMGRVMASLPLDIHITKLILLGHVFDVLEEAIIMGCAMSVRNIFSEPFLQRLHAYNNKLLWADSSESDSVAYLNAYMVWRQLTGVGKFNRGVGSEEAWSRRYLLQIKHLHEVAKMEDDIKKRLRWLNIQVVRQRGKPLWAPMEKPLILKLVLAGAFYPHYFSRSAQNPNAESEAVKMLAGHSPYNCVYLQNMPHPAPLYVDQIKATLKKQEISDDVQIYHDDSRKVVVAFNSGNDLSELKIGERNLHMNIPGEIVMPVYRAIKLRQLNTSITVKTLTPREVKEELSKLSLSSRSSMQSIITTECKPLITLYDNVIELQFTHVENAGHFYGHISENGGEELYRVQKILNTPGKTQRISGNIVEDGIYGAPYVDPEENQTCNYRAKIKRKFTEQGVLWVEVFFMDFGNSALMPAYELLQVVIDKEREVIESYPPLALECVLAEVCPSVWSNQGGQWSEAANNYVHRVLAIGRKLFCKGITAHRAHRTMTQVIWGNDLEFVIDPFAKIYSFIGGVAYVHLFLKENLEPSKEFPPTLNDELIKRGFARHREESYFSKLNHAKRVSQEKGDDVKYPCVAADDDDGCSMKSLSKGFLSLPTTTSGRPVELKGPNSPLEMKLFSMIRSSAQREVKVEWNSVNSVLLDSDPSDPHERLLIAGSVSQSSDGRKLTLNHTTVLPNMHGLAALVCLIFAPTVELRTDVKYSRYTGALCGLGQVSKGVPLFIENDIEIDFDVEFDNSDLLLINKLRYWLNERYCSDNADDMPDVNIHKIQTHIRDLSISLLKKVRRSVKVYHNVEKFLWGKVPEDRLYHPFPEADASDFCRFIYKLHSGINIDPRNDRAEIVEMVEKLENLQESLEGGLTPRFMKCDLCDLDFEYWNQLRLHLSSSYHQLLVEWLESRAKDHGLTISNPVNTQVNQ